MSCISTESVNQSFIANIPLILSTIKDMSLQSPSWFEDVYTPIPWPEGEGTTMQELTFRGELPEVEEGFDSWTKIDDPSGCGDVCAPNCAYNMHMLGGHAMQTKLTSLMKKDLRTPDYCVAAIQNTRQYQEMFRAIVNNLFIQMRFHREINIGQNFLTYIAKKFVIDSGGFKPNPSDPYRYRPKGDATLVALNIGALSHLYEMLRLIPDVQPFGFANNMPLYALVASPELIASMWRDDPALRADYRAAAASGGEYANNLINRYNFTSTLRDMFFPVGYLWPRRFRYDDSTDTWIRVLPWVKGIPGTVGTFAGINPLYVDPAYATHEEVLIHGRDPFTVYYQNLVQSIGEGTDFGPEPGGIWDNLQWVNPQTRDDPGRRVGFFFSTARIGLSSNNEGVYGLLVPRPGLSSIVAFYQNPPTPPAAPSDPTNVVPDVGCPHQMIISVTANPVVENQYFVTLAAPIDAEAEDVIQLGHSNGGYVNATVVALNSDGTVLSVTISGTLPVCDRWTTVYTGDLATLGCKAKVLQYAVDPTDSTRLDLILDRPIKADTASDTVTLLYGNGTQVSATVVGTPNQLTGAWKVDIGSSAFVNNVGGVVEICVPTATDSTCPGCSTSLVTEAFCEEEEEG